MKLSINWLKDYLDPKLSTEEMVNRLTMAGLEVESVEAHGKDTVIDLEVTPNRPDWLSVQGLARDIGAILQKKVVYPAIKNYAIKKSNLRIHIDDKRDCTRYVATLLSKAQVSQGGVWANYLNSVDMKAISNAVDITNYILMDMGQPLHVFDYDKIEGGEVFVRRAKVGERIVTLDGVERKLDPSILVIADAQKPIAIAGIMGGMDTQVTTATTNILLESASFNSVLIRRASRSLALRSDSSYRFERGVDINGVLAGANRATSLLIEATKATLVGRLDAYAMSKAKEKPISISANDVSRRLGLNLKPAQIKRGLVALGFKVSGSATFKVTASSFRRDINQTADLVEEIARLTGFDKLPMAMPVIKATNINLDTRAAQLKTLLRQVLVGAGMNETVTFAMTNTKALVKSNLGETKALRVFNPLSQDQELMRPSLLPSLLQVALTNISRGQKDLRLFEIGKRYYAEGEKETLAILLTGRRHNDWRGNKKEMVDFIDLKGSIERVLGAAGVTASFESLQWPAFDAQSAANIVLNGKPIGSLGKLAADVLRNWDIKNQDVYFAAIDLDSIITQPKVTKYQALAEFPSISRDVSLSVKRETPYTDVEAICRKQGGALLTNVQFIEQYVGDKIAADQKALVFSLIYQSHERTLREEEINASQEAIIKALIAELGATRR